MVNGESMKRKTLLITVCLAAVLAVAAGVGIYYLVQEKAEENKMVSTDTESFAILEVPSADTLMVGKWQNAENPKWYKVYCDDPDDDDEGYFWGKEWDESDEVFEEDLMYHGNGWFRWRKEKNQLTELHTMDAQDVPIAKIWKVQHLSSNAPNDSMIVINTERKSQCFHFTRMQH